jgi:hypothetical protein
MVMPNCCWDGIGEFSPLSYLDVMGRFSGLIDGALENYDDFKLSDLYMISEWHIYLKELVFHYLIMVI